MNLPTCALVLPVNVHKVEAGYQTRALARRSQVCLEQRREAANCKFSGNAEMCHESADWWARMACEAHDSMLAGGGPSDPHMFAGPGYDAMSKQAKSRRWESYYCCPEFEAECRELADFHASVAAFFHMTGA